MMRTVAVALACLTCTGRGRRLQTPSDATSRSHPQSKFTLSQSNTQASIFRRLRSLASTLLVLNPAGGWQLIAEGHKLLARRSISKTARPRVAVLDYRTKTQGMRPRCSEKIFMMPRYGVRDADPGFVNARKLGEDRWDVPEDADDMWLEEWLFFDRARIHVAAGDGGDGCTAMLREKDRPKLGPGGGDGGRGGSVYLVCDEGLNTLKPEIHHKAAKGQHGQGKCRDGSYGEDCYVRVPPGTVVREEESGGLIAELIEDGEQVRVARGGRGGRGNKAFKTPRNNLPFIKEKGEPGADRWLSLELKLVADVGLVGCPNAGKSSLLAATTRAAPKIASYPFTTVCPNLGVWESPNSGDYEAERSFCIADIPGLLEGAHDDVGLGLAFLRHIERCRLLVHIVDGSREDPIGDYEAIVTELKLFSPWLVKKPSVIVLNKLDIPEVREKKDELIKKLQQAAGHKRVIAISAATKENCEQLMKRLRKLLVDAKLKGPIERSDEPRVVLDSEELSDEFDVIKDGPDCWRVEGERIELACKMTNWDYIEAQERFMRIMKALGINERLKEMGAKDGDIIIIGQYDFQYFEETPMAARARLAGFIDYSERLMLEQMSPEERKLLKDSRKDLDKELEEGMSMSGQVLPW